MARYSIGLDFGTESVRALLVDLASGQEAAVAEFAYPSRVISEALPVEPPVPLPPDWFLQDPGDYLAGLEAVVPDVLHQAGVPGSQVVGLGLDFTACTVMPCDRQGAPLCSKPEFRRDPHSWVKLWKHHGAIAEAEHVLDVAEERGEKFLDYCAHTISSEWLIPKALETLRHARAVYQAADVFVEGGDWVVWQLTGELVRNACCAGYKGQYVAELGWPSSDFLAAVAPGLADLCDQKLRGPIVAPGRRAGGLGADWADRLGLLAGTPVAAASIDAHAAVPGCGVTEPGTMVLVLGTSFCHMLLGDDLQLFEGLACVVRDGILPGFYGYESGQTAGGDVFAWFVDTCVPAAYAAEAERAGMSLHEFLSVRAGNLRPGQSGLVALDWWNGNRSVLMDGQLSGLMVGLTLDTRPEEMYRACIEATMFGTRRIVESYRQAHVPVDRFVACGGLPHKNPLAMQILADVLNSPVRVAQSQQTGALGSALMGAAAAGSQAGGYDSIAVAAADVVRPPETAYSPRTEAARTYDELYREYLALHDYFGRTERLMHRLRALRLMGAAD